MVIFWRLLFGHLLADFTFQTNHINHWKRTSIWGMLAHCVTHPICYIALTYPFLNDIWVEVPGFPLSGWLCVLLVFLGHLVEDQWRVFTIFRYNLPDNTLYFFWDQIIHYVIIFSVIPATFRGGMPTSLVPEAWPVLGCLFVAVTHAGTILVYFIDKDFFGGKFPENKEKYASMGERLVLALLFLVPHMGAATLLVAAWLFAMRQIRSKRLLDLSWTSFYLGGGLAAFCGILARLVCYDIP